jgi:ABC transporter with metal-binding/Fe-S-binding domain ATP-binding protein
VIEMRLASLFSGGKDSTYATYLASKEHKIKYLVSFYSENPESYMFHTANIKMTELQAQKMNIKHVIVNTKGEKEAEVKDIEKALGLLDIEGVVSGAVASTYQKNRVDKVCKNLNVKSIAPIWQIDPAKLLDDIVAADFHTIISSVSAQGLDKSWLGRMIDKKTVEELKAIAEKYQINPAGEGGEYCTTVLNCPLFKKPVTIRRFKKIWQDDRGHLEILEAD